MILFRSYLYVAWMALLTFLYGLPFVLLSPLMTYQRSIRSTRDWARLNLWGLKTICRLTYQIHGLENLPKNGGLIVSKHQSTWETILFRAQFPLTQTWVVKQELLKIPLFGPGLKRLKPIAIDRSAGSKALKQVIEEGKAHLARGNLVVIFPEGTRVKPGEQVKFNPGAAMLANKAQQNIVPIVHNSGVFWRHGSVIKYPGTIQVVIGKPIAITGLSTGEINQKIEAWIVQESAKLPVDWQSN